MLDVSKTRPLLRRKLLDWYDANARALPWRVGPREHAAGVRADPYRVWLSEVMLQQTTVPHATPYFLEFTRRWRPSPLTGRQMSWTAMSSGSCRGSSPSRRRFPRPSRS
jgi:adenine-specific DNA glycosylase